MIICIYRNRVLGKNEYYVFTNNLVTDMQIVPVTSFVKMPFSIKYKGIRTSVKKPAAQI